MAVALPLACAAVVAASVPALAHHPAVTAAVDCDGRVSFTVVAWQGFPDDPATAANERELSRTNGEIQVSVSLDGGQTFRQLPADGGYRLEAGNGFSFTDSFRLPDPLPATLIVQARGLGTWGDSDELGGARQTPAIQVPTCDPTARDGVPPGTGDAYGSYDTSDTPSDSYGDDTSAAGDAADGDSSSADPEDADGGSSGADGSSSGDATGGDASGAGGTAADGSGADGYGEYGSGSGDGQGGAERASARVAGTPRGVGPAAFTLGALALAGGAAALIAAGLWARRRVLEL